MADVNINGLGGPLASPAADDVIPVWDTSSGQTLKIRRDVFVGATITGGGTLALGGYTLTVPASMTAAGRDVANTFSQLQTLTSGAAIGAAGNTLTRVAAGVVRQKVELTTIVATGDVSVQTGNGGRGLVLVYNATLGKLALFAVEGSTGTIIWGDAANFSGSNGTTNGKTNCFVLSNVIYVQNGTAGSIQVQVLVLL